jgi:hypothetical protein
MKTTAPLTIETYVNRLNYAPGDALEGLVSWHFDHPPDWLELRLFWYTTGKGDKDVHVVTRMTFEQPASVDSQIYSLILPHGPYSYSGRLTSLIWALELITKPNNDAVRLEIVVGPASQEIDLYKYQSASERKL